MAHTLRLTPPGATSQPPPLNYPYRVAAPSSAPTPIPTIPCCPARSGGQRSRGRARSRRHPRAAPSAPRPPLCAPRCAAPGRSAPSASNAWRLTRAVQREDTLQQAVLARMGGDRAGTEERMLPCHGQLPSLPARPASANLLDWYRWRSSILETAATQDALRPLALWRKLNVAMFFQHYKQATITIPCAWRQELAKRKLMKIGKEMKNKLEEKLDDLSLRLYLDRRMRAADEETKLAEESKRDKIIENIKRRMCCSQISFPKTCQKIAYPDAIGRFFERYSYVVQ